ncbi:exodeoxyribonuclease VII large subunit [Alicyclobacillus sp.]|uniref:exodeoxyribonuclease VII large subunit n=1 Tax=Alicyclobacillus sp. TaxID=61169 RepID=UPI0025BB25D3|nr:exodeoxyribonuclease VII large subunit [Alicyclobacillus sp.]
MTATAAKVFSVTELNRFIGRLLQAEEQLARCYVAGEISNFKLHSSGHMYFTLKDETGRLRAVMFANRNRRLTFRPEDGMRVIALGSVQVYDRDGQYQLYVEDMQPDGVGALYVAFTQLRERLEAEGLFSPERKRPLPTYPRRIGVVTSPTGAVIRDICSTLSRRYPLAKVVLSPALVQGPTAAPTIVEAIARLVRYHQERFAIDVIIVARGGGSLEELWPFNEELVARAVAACPIPVVSAVGHETDYTICDFVADVRAATPTAAAELVAPAISDLRLYLTQYASRAQSAITWRLGAARERLQALGQAHALRRPMHVVHVRRQALDSVEHQLQQQVRRPVALAQRRLGAVRDRLYRLDLRQRVVRASGRVEKLAETARLAAGRRHAAQGARLERVTASLIALNPLAVLKRGYSVVYREGTQEVVTAAASLRAGDRVHVQFADGRVAAKILDEEGETGRAARHRAAGRDGEGSGQLRLDL